MKYLLSIKMFTLRFCRCFIFIVSKTAGVRRACLLRRHCCLNAELTSIAASATACGHYCFRHCCCRLRYLLVTGAGHPAPTADESRHASKHELPGSLDKPPRAAAAISLTVQRLVFTVHSSRPPRLSAADCWSLIRLLGIVQFEQLLLQYI